MQKKKLKKKMNSCNIVDNTLTHSFSQTYIDNSRI